MQKLFAQITQTGLLTWLAQQTESPETSFDARGFLIEKNGGYLLSHGCAVPSARAGLTSLFGMGRGGTPPL